MLETTHGELSRRERQIMDIVYQLGSASAADVQARLPQAPSYSAVRAMLRVLEDKGHVEHRQDGPRYVYEATVPVEAARRSAVDRLLRTFFDNSLGEAFATLLDSAPSKLSREELDRLADMIEQAKQEGH
jgi:BlaI family penicillinase repressor